ncbi:MAG: hypothetical protein M3Q48_11870 [Actinomycetota bacterium]|nr:hypothetical protein [Actinomycetota bacterium]
MERDEARFHVADGVAVLHRAGHQSDASGVEERLAAVAGEEADVRHDNGIGARPDLGAPAARLEERPGPLEGLLDLRPAETLGGLDVHDGDEPGRVDEKEVGDVPTPVLVEQNGCAAIATVRASKSARIRRESSRRLS